MRLLDISTISGIDDVLRVGNEFIITHLKSEDESFHLVNGSVKAGFTFHIHVLKGGIDISLNDRHYSVSKDQIFTCNNGAIIHDLHMDKETSAVLMGYYMPYFFPEHNSYALTQVWDRIMEPITLNMNPDRTAASIAQMNLCKLILRKITDYELRKEAVIGFLRITLASIGQWYFNDYSDLQKEKGEENKLFSFFIRDVRENCINERSVSYYASHAHLSPKYFSSLIYKYSGIHAAEWIRKYTIVMAKGMLKSKQFTVQQVSEKMNFPNSSFFGKYFKDAVGVTPRQYMYNDEI